MARITVSDNMHEILISDELKDAMLKAIVSSADTTTKHVYIGCPNESGKTKLMKRDMER